MAPDLMEKPSMLYYTGEDGIERAIKGTLSIAEVEQHTYCDIDQSFLEEQHNFSIKLTKKQMHQWEKLIGLIKPVYKKKRKGRRYVWYELY